MEEARVHTKEEGGKTKDKGRKREKKNKKLNLRNLLMDWWVPVRRMPARQAGNPESWCHRWRVFPSSGSLYLLSRPIDRMGPTCTREGGLLYWVHAVAWGLKLPASLHCLGSGFVHGDHASVLLTCCQSHLFYLVNIGIDWYIQQLCTRHYFLLCNLIPELKPTIFHLLEGSIFTDSNFM